MEEQQAQEGSPRRVKTRRLARKSAMQHASNISFDIMPQEFHALAVPCPVC